MIFKVLIEAKEGKIFGIDTDVYPAVDLKLDEEAALDLIGGCMKELEKGDDCFKVLKIERVE